MPAQKQLRRQHYTLRSCYWNAIRIFTASSPRLTLVQYMHVTVPATVAIMTTICRCSVKDCTRTSRNSECSFFRFPKDIERAKIWVMACKREDLADKLDKLHNSSYRVCGAHFRKEMFASDLKNRLQRLAVPTIFPQPKKTHAQTQVLPGTTIYILQAAPGMVQGVQPQKMPGIITYTKPVPPLQKAPSPSPDQQVAETDPLSNEEQPMEVTATDSLDDSFTIVKEELNIETEDVKPPPLSPSPLMVQIKEEPPDQLPEEATENVEDTSVSFVVKEEPPSPGPNETTLQQQQQQQLEYTQIEKPTCHRQVQTSADLILHAPRVQKLKRSLKMAENHNFVLKQKNAKLTKAGNRSILETITFTDYKRLTYAFCPSKSVADSVIREVSKARQAAVINNINNGINLGSG